MRNVDLPPLALRVLDGYGAPQRGRETLRRSLVRWEGREGREGREGL